MLAWSREKKATRRVSIRIYHAGHYMHVVMRRAMVTEGPGEISKPPTIVEGRSEAANQPSSTRSGEILRHVPGCLSGMHKVHVDMWCG